MPQSQLQTFTTAINIYTMSDVGFHWQGWYLNVTLAILSNVIIVICAILLTIMFIKSLDYVFCYTKRQVRRLSDSKAMGIAKNQLKQQRSSNITSASPETVASKSPSPIPRDPPLDPTFPTLTDANTDGDETIASQTQPHDQQQHVQQQQQPQSPTQSHILHIQTKTEKEKEEEKEKEREREITITRTRESRTRSYDYSDNSHMHDDGGYYSDPDFSKSKSGKKMSVEMSEIVEKERKIHLQRKKQKQAVIRRTHWTNKSLLISSLFWAILQVYSYIITNFLIVFLNIRKQDCGDRSVVIIYYAFQRFSVAVFFIIRLYFSFENSIFALKKEMIGLFIIFSLLSYFGSAIYYVYTAYDSQDNDSIPFDCDSTRLFVPVVWTLVVDVLWNSFLSCYFLFKLRQVKNILYQLFLFVYFFSTNDLLSQFAI